MCVVTLFLRTLNAALNILSPNFQCWTRSFLRITKSIYFSPDPASAATTAPVQQLAREAINHSTVAAIERLPAWLSSQFVYSSGIPVFEVHALLVKKSSVKPWKIQALSATDAIDPTVPLFRACGDATAHDRKSDSPAKISAMTDAPRAAFQCLSIEKFPVL